MTRTRRTVAQRASENRDRLRAMESVAGKLKAWRPRREVLRRVEAVPTCFPQYDEAAGVGGHPIARTVLVHGPSNHGKTEFCLGLGKSFLERDHFFGFVDAERSTPEPWLYELMGSLADHPGFMALPTNTYEEVRAAVRAWCEGIAAERGKKLPEDITGLIVVDSIRKLLPKAMWEMLCSDPTTEERRKKVGMDGRAGRGGQLKAAFNSVWNDELTPLLAETRCAMVIITRETVVDDDDGINFDEDYRVAGGSGLVYDSHLRLRVVRASTLYEGEEKRMIGERHRVEVRKTKVGQKLQRVPAGHFHTSNGQYVAVGFDRPRDVLELALELDVAKLAGSHVKIGGKSIGQGVNAAVKRLHQQPELVLELEQECRARFREAAQVPSRQAGG